MPNLRNTPTSSRQLVTRFMKSPCYSLTNCVCVWKIITAEVQSLNPKSNVRKRLQPVINPGATANSIRSWRKNWREPRQPRADKRTLAFITIRIHRSLYDFDKSGQPTGVIAAGQAVEINQKIIDLLKPLDVFVRIDSKLEHLLEGYDKRRVAAEKRMEKAKRRHRPSRKGPRKRGSHIKI